MVTKCDPVPSLQTTGCPPVSHRIRERERERRLRFFGRVARADPKQDQHRVIGASLRPPVIGGDLVDALVPAGLGRLILMYSQSTSGSTQPGERPVTTRSGNVSSTRQHSIMEHTTEARLCIRVLHKLVGLQLSVHTSIRTAMPQQTTDESASL